MSTPKANKVNTTKDSKKTQDLVPTALRAITSLMKRFKLSFCVVRAAVDILTDEYLAFTIVKLHEAGWNIRRIARHIRKSDKFVSNAIKVYNAHNGKAAKKPVVKCEKPVKPNKKTNNKINKKICKPNKKTQK